jgi:hypothetical protein
LLPGEPTGSLPKGGLEGPVDAGYYSESEAQAPEEHGVEAFVAVERQTHGRSRKHSVRRRGPKKKGPVKTPKHRALWGLCPRYSILHD